jgi:hypothetical protein
VIQSENKRFKPKTSSIMLTVRKSRKGTTRSSENVGPTPDKSKEKYYRYCKINIYMEKFCFHKNAKGKEKEDSSDLRPNRYHAQLAAIDNSGKEKALAIPPNH